MTTKEEKELTEAIGEFERTENMTDEEIEQEAIETYGSRAEELDYIMERLTELSKRDFRRFDSLTLQTQSLSSSQQHHGRSLEMMPEMRAMKQACDEFVEKAEKVLGKLKEQQEAEDEQD